MYLKIQVPDDFDLSEVSKEAVVLNFIKEGRVERIPTKFWEPVYVDMLDHGFIGLKDFMGDDCAVVDAARVSYGQGTVWKRTDEGLIRYLMRHRHDSPFEMVVFKFHVKAPIFIFRQWHRHRAFSLNEYSARYSVLDNEMYLPMGEVLKPQSLANKQGRAEDVLSERDQLAVVAALEQSFDTAWQTYSYLLAPKVAPPDQINTRKLWVEEAALAAIKKIQTEENEKWIAEENDERFLPQVWTNEMIDAKILEYYEGNELAVTSPEFPGLARELARICLPVATYSQMIWQGNLRNLFHFIGLRSDPHAQHEIRVYSDALLKLIEPFVPACVKAFLDYQMNGATFSRIELETLRLIAQQMNGLEWVGPKLLELGASQREVTEFLKKVIG